METNQSTAAVLTPEKGDLTAKENIMLTRAMRYLQKNNIGDGKNGQFRRVQLLTIEDFLPAEDLADLLEYTVSNEANFQTSMVQRADVSETDVTQRRSRILGELGERYENIIARRVLSVLPEVLHQLEMAPFMVERVDAQLTATNHEEFFKMHLDAGKGELQRRYLTFVYYFYREPKAFTGGELHLHDTLLVDGLSFPLTSFQSVVPLRNQVVFFPSFLQHEVMPVNCPSQQFADSRFTINGWLIK